jgi:hypothetical protein
MTIKGTPEAGFVLSDRCEMNGLAACASSSSLITFDLQYIICPIRFGEDICGTGNLGCADTANADTSAMSCPYDTLTEVASA